MEEGGGTHHEGEPADEGADHPEGVRDEGEHPAVVEEVGGAVLALGPGEGGAGGDLQEGEAHPHHPPADHDLEDGEERLAPAHLGAPAYFLDWSVAAKQALFLHKI